MRTSLLLAIISVLVASVAAHEGEHGAVDSVCLTTPTNTTCSNFTIPSASLTGPIGEICKTSSYLPGCSLNAACTADSKLNTTYCAPLTILASLCNATDDTAVTSTVCSKSYSVFCSANSLIPGCKSQAAFPGLPSGKAVAGTVYSICLEMPMMTDCKICPAPVNGYSDCDEVKAWKGLCLDMPDMKQCPSFNTMCNNTKFAPFCDFNYKAPVTNPGDQKPSGAGMVVGSWVLSTLLAVAAGATALVL